MGAGQLKCIALELGIQLLDVDLEPERLQLAVGTRLAGRSEASVAPRGCNRRGRLDSGEASGDDNAGLLPDEVSQIRAVLLEDELDDRRAIGRDERPRPLASRRADP